MTIPRLDAMVRYWEHSPPVHVMLASYFEIKGKSKEKSTDKKADGDVQPFGDIFKVLPL